MSETFFYGIDFKKIQLYCKFKIKTKEARLKYNDMLNSYLNVSSIKLRIDNEKYYKVELIDFDIEKVAITVNCLKRDNEDRIKIKLDFNMVDFSYFFEETKENELEVLDF